MGAHGQRRDARRLEALPPAGVVPVGVDTGVPSPAAGWTVVRRRGEAAALHSLGAGTGSGRTARVLRVTSPAVVLGSTQSDSDLDTAAVSRAGLQVARRRSGGGAVLVEPGEMVWIDVVVPRGDPLWHDDVGRAFWWLGDAWSAALASLGLGGARTHRGPLRRSRWSSLVCFAGLGPGEVTLGGRKVVGMAQRRTRTWALFQCALPLRWEPDRLLGVLALGPEERAAASAGLRGWLWDGGDLDAAEVEAALLEHLPPGR